MSSNIKCTSGESSFVKSGLFKMKILRFCLYKLTFPVWFNRYYSLKPKHIRNYCHKSQSYSICSNVPGTVLVLLTVRPSGLLFFHLYVPLASLHSKFLFQSLKARGTVMGQSQGKLAWNHRIKALCLPLLMDQVSNYFHKLCSSFISSLKCHM